MKLNKKINESLNGFIKGDSLSSASKEAMKNLSTVDLMLDLSSKKFCTSCGNKSCKDLVFPILKPNSDVLFLFSTVDEYDMAAHTFFGRGSRFLYSLINNLHIDNYSISTVVKCGKCIEEDVYNKCYSLYLIRELNIIRPKKIVCFGQSACNIVKTFLLKDNNYFNKNDDCAGVSKYNDTDVLFTNDLNYVLSFSENEMTERKNKVWKDLKNFFK